MSDCARSSSSETGSTPSSAARAGVTNGSNARSRTFHGLRRAATREPTWPRPTRPTVLPWSSVPTNFVRFHSPAFSEACASGIRRRSASRSAMACSAAETTLPDGAFTTRTPRSVAALTSTLSRPTPARPTTRSFFPAARSSLSTWVADRTTRAS